MSQITMTPKEITKKTVAIVKFGPATPSSGMKPAEYYQVTIDPAHRSPSGDYIRFGLHKGDEIVGWQRAEALTVVEILAEWEGEKAPEVVSQSNGGVTMLVIGE